MSFAKDLVVLVADTDAKVTVETLLARRCTALGIRRLPPSSWEVIRHPRRDNGVYHEGVELLRGYVRTHRYALVLFDHEGCGVEGVGAEELERRVEDRLRESGWAERAAVVVLDPELERWVWTPSRHLPEVIGLEADEFADITVTFSLDPLGKPARPKEALLKALGRSGRPFSPAIFKELAARASVRHCRDRAFLRLRDCLRAWFPSNAR